MPRVMTQMQKKSCGPEYSPLPCDYILILTHFMYLERKTLLLEI